MMAHLRGEKLSSGTHKGDEDVHRRLRQIAEEQDHTLCSQSTQEAVKADILAQLKILGNEVKRDNWKYSRNIFKDNESRHGPQVASFF